MKTEILDILNRMLVKVSDANMDLRSNPVNGFEPYIKARVNAQIEAAERIEAVYVDRIKAMAERAEEMQQERSAKCHTGNQ